MRLLLPGPMDCTHTTNYTTTSSLLPCRHHASNTPGAAWNHNSQFRLCCTLLCASSSAAWVSTSTLRSCLKCTQKRLSFTSQTRPTCLHKAYHSCTCNSHTQGGMQRCTTITTSTRTYKPARKSQLNPNYVVKMATRQCCGHCATHATIC